MNLVIQVREYLRAEPAWTNPDVSVLWPPVERLRVDKVRSSKGCEPCCEECDRGCQAKGIRAQPLRWQLAARDPGVGCNHSLWDSVSKYCSRLTIGEHMVILHCSP